MQSSDRWISSVVLVWVVQKSPWPHVTGKYTGLKNHPYNKFCISRSEEYMQPCWSNCQYIILVVVVATSSVLLINIPPCFPLVSVTSCKRENTGLGRPTPPHPFNFFPTSCQYLSNSRSDQTWRGNIWVLLVVHQRRFQWSLQSSLTKKLCRPSGIDYISTGTWLTGSKYEIIWQSEHLVLCLNPTTINHLTATTIAKINATRH